MVFSADNSILSIARLWPPINEKCYAMTFGGDYGYKDGAESIIFSACTESIRLSAHTESIILTAPPAESLILSAPPAESMILSAHAESMIMILSARAESIILSLEHTESVILSLHHSKSIILSLYHPENITFSALFSCVMRLTVAATKKQQLAILMIANLRLCSTAPQLRRRLVCRQRGLSFATL
jgi:hypothetical protein